MHKFVHISPHRLCGSLTPRLTPNDQPNSEISSNSLTDFFVRTGERTLHRRDHYWVGNQGRALGDRAIESHKFNETNGREAAK